MSVGGISGAFPALQLGGGIGQVRGEGAPQSAPAGAGIVDGFAFAGSGGGSGGTGQLIGGALNPGLGALLNISV